MSSLGRIGLAIGAGLASLAFAPPATPPAPAAAGATVALPPPRTDGAVALEKSLAGRRSVREFARTPLTLAEVSQLLWAAQGENRPDGRRTAPSAGALYPLEVYLLAGEVEGLPRGLYHYQPHGHRLGRVSDEDRRAALQEAARDQECVGESRAVVVLAAVPARTAVKYGERAERYVEIEVGHAAQNLMLQATALGLGSVPVGAFSDEAVGRVLGLAAGERASLLVPLGRPR